MIDHFEDLSLDDKLFAVVNVNNFSLPSRSAILFNKTEIFDSIEEKCGKWCIDKAIKKSYDIYENANNMAKKYAASYSLANLMIATMKNGVSESPEDIKNLLFVYADVRRRLKNVSCLAYPNMDPVYRNLANIFMYIFININLRVHEIWCKSNKVYDGDDLCENEICKSLSNLFKLIGTASNNSECIDLVGIISKYFGYTDALCKCLVLLVSDLCEENSVSKDELLKLVNSSVSKGAITFDDSNLEFEELKLLNNKENYDKDTLSERLRRGGAIIGKNVLGDMDVEEASIEIDKITDEFISYFDENFKSFSIDENKLGELINEGCNTAVYCRKDGSIRHLLNHNSKPFLLYESGDKKLHGIHLESNGFGQRTILDIDFPIPFKNQYMIISKVEEGVEV